MPDKKQDAAIIYESVYDLLHNIQTKMKAPKGQYNKFGMYHYRSCEDIVEAVKGFLPQGAYLLTSDSIQPVNDRFYVVAEAVLTYKNSSVRTTGWARESLVKKGMDESQITGAASSYARKYALNGLLLIDDNDDSDKTNKEKKDAKPPAKGSKSPHDDMAADALGGSIRDGVDDETREKMYQQGLVSLSGCADFDGLKKVWANLYKGRMAFTTDQLKDLQQKYEECKIEFNGDAK